MIRDGLSRSTPHPRLMIASDGLEGKVVVSICAYDLKRTELRHELTQSIKQLI